MRPRRTSSNQIKMNAFLTRNPLKQKLRNKVTKPADTRLEDGFRTFLGYLWKGVAKMYHKIAEGLARPTTWSEGHVNGFRIKKWSPVNCPDYIYKCDISVIFTSPRMKSPVWAKLLYSHIVNLTGTLSRTALKIRVCANFVTLFLTFSEGLHGNRGILFLNWSLFVQSSPKNFLGSAICFLLTKICEKFILISHLIF